MANPNLVPLTTSRRTYTQHNKTVTNNLRKIWEEAGITQTELARLLGRTQPYVAALLADPDEKLKRGVIPTAVPAAMIIPLATILNVQPAQIDPEFRIPIPISRQHSINIFTGQMELLRTVEIDVDSPDYLGYLVTNNDHGDFPQIGDLLLLDPKRPPALRKLILAETNNGIKIGRVTHLKPLHINSKMIKVNKLYVVASIKPGWADDI